MLLALVHLATGTHATLKALKNRAQRATASQSFKKRTGRITDDLGELDQTALLILPGKQDDEPVSSEHFL
jgi:hypothetical protein